MAVRMRTRYQYLIKREKHCKMKFLITMREYFNVIIGCENNVILEGFSSSKGKGV
jgi:hypothetical protein